MHPIGPHTLALAAQAAGGNGQVLQTLLTILQQFGPTLLQIIETYLAGHGPSPVPTPAPPQGN